MITRCYISPSNSSVREVGSKHFALNFEKALYYNLFFFNLETGWPVQPCGNVLNALLMEI